MTNLDQKRNEFLVKTKVHAENIAGVEAHPSRDSQVAKHFYIKGFTSGAESGFDAGVLAEREIKDREIAELKEQLEKAERVVAIVKADASKPIQIAGYFISDETYQLTEQYFKDKGEVK